MQTSFNQHSLVLWIVLAVITVLLLLWLLAVHSRSRRIEARLDDLLAGADEENVGRMLVEYLSTVRTTAAAVDHMQQQHDSLSRIVPGMMRHIGLVRFSPFHDTGGDQSFTLAILDSRHDGVVITGLHSRTDSRLYAKPIHGGDSEYSLIPEERRAIATAVSDDRQPAVSG